ncbi:MAG: hypothetical protein WEA04_02935 [Candidatus Andersenbacteria bacterium]
MDITSLWVWSQQHRSVLVFLVVGIVLFGAGWQVGRVMSPYYASHPIVFSDQAYPDKPSAGGTAEALQVLQADGQALADEKNNITTESSTPTVAAVQQTAPPTAGTLEKLFVASVNSDKYHHRDCAARRQIKAENEVWFNSAEEAESAGYVPSQCTREKLGQPAT